MSTVGEQIRGEKNNRWFSWKNPKSDLELRVEGFEISPRLPERNSVMSNKMKRPVILSGLSEES